MKMICDVPDEVIKCIKDGMWCGSHVLEKMIENGIPLSSSENPNKCEDDKPCMECPKYDHEKHNCPHFCHVIKGVLKEKPNKWIPIKTRPLTNKEKEEYADLGYSEDSIDSMYDCQLPEDGEEVFITTRYDEVTTDTFYRDEGCYFETYCDKDDVKAWMPLPEPYKMSEMPTGSEGSDTE